MSSKKLGLLGAPALKLASPPGIDSGEGVAQADAQPSQAWGSWARKGIADVIGSLSTRATADYESPAASKETPYNDIRVRDMSSWFVGEFR